MKQKLLEALKAKFPGDNAAVPDKIANKLAKTATTEEQVTTAVAGVTQEFIDIIESYVADIDALKTESLITPFTITGESDTINALMSANGGKALMSQRESIEVYGKSDDTLFSFDDYPQLKRRV